MNKSTLIVALLFFVFLTQGGFLLLHSASTGRQRLMGGVCLCVCLFIVFQANMKIGIIPEADRAEAQRKMHNMPEDSELKKAIIHAVGPNFDKMGQIGLVVGACCRGRQAIASFGTTAIRSGTAPTGSTVFEIGSISKLFTAGLLAAAMERRQLSLDTRAADLLTPSGPLEPNTQLITLGHLVTHTSGLPRMSSDIFHPVELLNSLAGGTPYSIYSVEKVKNIFINSRVEKAPGERIKYSNIGFGLLGLLLSEQAGMSYEQLIRKTITGPLGMEDTVIHLNQGQRERFAQGYRGCYHLRSFYLAQTAAPSEFGKGLVGGGGLRSTGNDMLRFLVANLNNASASPFSFLRQTHGMLRQDSDMQIGMGWFSMKLPKSDQSILYHDGISGGFSGFVALDIEHQTGVVMLGNVSSSITDRGCALMDQLIQYPVLNGHR